MVDDDPGARELISGMFVKDSWPEGEHRREAARAAPSAAVRAAAGLLIADLGMPGMDGYTLIEQVRGLSPTSRRTDTRGGRNGVRLYREERLRALQAGYQNHVAKPVEAEELAIVIASLAGRLAQDKRA